MELISTKWLVILLCSAGWTVFFSLFNTPGIRGWRNLGWLASFLIGFSMFFVLPWPSAIATWALMGVSSGMLYYCYEWYSYFTSKPEEEVPWPWPTTIAHGLFAWPIMLPEAIEYWLADLCVLRSEAATPNENAEQRVSDSGFQLSSHFCIREAGHERALDDVRGEIALTTHQDGDRPTIRLDLQILAEAAGEEAVFWLRRLGPVQNDRLALQHRDWDAFQGGFYCHEHVPLENLCLVAFQKSPSQWRAVAVVDLMSAGDSTQRLEIDVELHVVQSIKWVCG